MLQREIANKAAHNAGGPTTPPSDKVLRAKALAERTKQALAESRPKTLDEIVEELFGKCGC